MKNMSEDYLLIKYFIDKAKILALEFKEQEKIALELGIGDYITEDIANDWFTDDIKFLNELKEKKLISYKSVELFFMINANFTEASLNGNSFEKDIWTLKGLENHVFWKKQRGLALEFIVELSRLE